MNIRELRPCKKCGKMISGLEEFPGQICLNCHKQKFENGEETLPTPSEMKQLFGVKLFSKNKNN